MENMTCLSLFSGGGGGLIGEAILGWRHVGYVEIEEHARQTILQRIEDGVLDPAPVFGDIEEFIRGGYAKAYSDLVDVITGGFPCQPFSIAGRRKGKHDSRNLWPKTIECIRIVRPRYCLLENVPGLLGASDSDSGERNVEAQSGVDIRYFGTILRDISEARYDARWITLGADDAGAPHRRKRIWILLVDNAYGERFGLGGQPEPRRIQGASGELFD